MFDATSVSESVSDRDLERCDGVLRLVMGRRAGESRLLHLFQRSPMRAILPRVDGRNGAEVVLLNTAGGVAGGDRLSVAMRVQEGAACVVTTQAAEKIYRALDAPARIETEVAAADGALCEWLPQQTIVFDGARLDRRTLVDVSCGGRVLALEWLVLGRTARREIVRTGSLRDVWRVVRDGRLVWADAFRMEGDMGKLAARRALLDGGDSMATLIYAAPDAARLIETARRALEVAPCPAGATLVASVLVCRFVAHGGAALHRAVATMLSALRPHIDGAGAAPPRVWGF